MFEPLKKQGYKFHVALVECRELKRLDTNLLKHLDL